MAERPWIATAVAEKIAELEAEHARMSEQMRTDLAALAARITTLKSFASDMLSGKYGEAELSRLALMMNEGLIRR